MFLSSSVAENQHRIDFLIQDFGTAKIIVYSIHVVPLKMIFYFFDKVVLAA